MPPSRRRPVPTTPTVRPRVAGLRKRPEAEVAPAKPEGDVEATSAEAARAAEARDVRGDAGTRTGGGARTANERAEDERAAGSAEAGLRDADRAEGGPAVSDRVPGLIEPGEGVADEHRAEPGDDEPAPRPRPTGRRRRTGEAVAASVLTDDEPKRRGTASTGRGVGATRVESVRGGLVLPVALVVLAGLLVGLGVWFQDQAGKVRYNQALVDSAATTEVAGQTREAVEKAFSYNFADVSATEKAADELLVGKAKCQYDAIFGPVRTLAPEQKLVVTVKAVSGGVTSLDGDRATVLLFLDQVTTRTTDNQSGGGIAMMRVGAQKVDGRWKVDNMEMFGQTGDQAAETAKC